MDAPAGMTSRGVRAVDSDGRSRSAPIVSLKRGQLTWTAGRHHLPGRRTTSVPRVRAAPVPSHALSGVVAANRGPVGEFPTARAAIVVAPAKYPNTFQVRAKNFLAAHNTTQDTRTRKQ